MPRAFGANVIFLFNAGLPDGAKCGKYCQKPLFSKK